MSLYQKYRPYLWAILGLGLFTVLFHQYNNWDFKNYHWYDAYAFFNARLNDIAPAQLQTYFNPYLDAFNYLVVKLLVFPVFYQFFFGVLWFIPLCLFFKIAERLLSYLPSDIYRFALIIAVIIGITDHAVYAQMGLAFTDPEAITFVMIALYCAVRSIDVLAKPQAVYYFVVAGLSMGLALGLKLTTSPYFFGFSIAWLCYPKNYLRRFYLFLIFLLGFLFTFLLTEGYWLWHMYQLFGNPLFPQFNDVFHSPYADFLPFKDNRYLPTSLFQAIFFPFYWLHASDIASEGHFRNWRLAILIVLSLLSLIKLFTHSERVRSLMRLSSEDRQLWSFLLVFLLVSYAFWLKIFAIYRYLIPVPLFSGVVIVAFSLWLLKTKTLRFKKYFLSSLTAIILLTSHYGVYGHLPFSRVKVSIPPLPAHAYVIMPVTIYPLAYLIPYASPDVAFISPLNNFMNPMNGSNNLLQARIADIIHRHQYPLFVIDYPGSEVAPLLQHYHLSKVTSTCKAITSNIDRSRNFEICELNYF